MTIRELYRRSRRDWFGAERLRDDPKRRLAHLQMVVFHTIGDYVGAEWGVHDNGRVANAILRGDREPNSLRALLRFYRRLERMEGRFEDVPRRAETDDAAILQAMQELEEDGLFELTYD